MLDEEFDWPSGLLTLKSEGFPVPLFAPGGGPAGVVEFPNREIFCLLVGVVAVTSPDGALLVKRPPPPDGPPKGFEAAAASAGLFGVENKLPEGALLAG